MVEDNRLSVNVSKLRDVVSVAKRTMTILLTNIDKDIMAKPDSVDDYKKYNEYMNTIITSHLRNKLNIG